MIVFLSILLLAAAIIDLKTYRIPNYLILSGILAALAFHFSSDGFNGLLFSFLGIVVGIGLLIIPYLMGGMGAGDAKLMGAVGGMLGPKGVFIAFLLTALVGGIYALGILAYYGGFRETLLRYLQMLKIFFLTGKVSYVSPPVQDAKPRLRYGIAISLGTVIAVFMNNKIDEILHLN